MAGKGDNKLSIKNLAAQFGVKVIKRLPTNNTTDSPTHNKNYQTNDHS